MNTLTDNKKVCIVYFPEYTAPCCTICGETPGRRLPIMKSSSVLMHNENISKIDTEGVKQ